MLLKLAITDNSAALNVSKEAGEHKKCCHHYLEIDLDNENQNDAIKAEFKRSEK